MKTPTLTPREALARISVALEEAERNGALPYSLDGLWEMADEALTAQPELLEPTFVYKTITSGGNAGLSGYFDNVSGSVLRDGTELYTADQIQQAVEQAQANREPVDVWTIFVEKIRQDVGVKELVNVMCSVEKLEAIFTQAAIEAHHGIGGKE